MYRHTLSSGLRPGPTLQKDAEGKEEGLHLYWEQTETEKIQALRSEAEVQPSAVECSGRLPGGSSGLLERQV